jgi:hypothetical protein
MMEHEVVDYSHLETVPSSLPLLSPFGQSTQRQFVFSDGASGDVD